MPFLIKKTIKFPNRKEFITVVPTEQEAQKIKEDNLKEFKEESSRLYYNLWSSEADHGKIISEYNQQILDDLLGGIYHGDGNERDDVINRITEDFLCSIEYEEIIYNQPKQKRLK